jgi:hypothetical protein
MLKETGSRPTIFYDELDTIFGPTGRYDENIRRFINSGYSSTGSVRRKGWGGSSRSKVVWYPTYAAMALAGAMSEYHVPATIRSRAIIMQMQRAAAHEKVERWDRRNPPPEAAQLYQLLELWSEFVGERADELLPEIPEGIRTRDADKWAPLLTVAELAGGRWPDIAQAAAVAAVAAVAAQATPSRGIQLLGDIKAVFDKLGVERLFTTELLKELHNMEESPWSRLTDRQMADLLRGYNVHSADQKIPGTNTVRKGYRREYFEDAWQRYIPE